jgi:glyoxylase-like metal-dependent hydrolase (beta-lactamase superfamily II)
MTFRAVPLLGNSQRLDGGAMFGNAPRALWQRWAAPDDDNRIALACRCLLVEVGGRRLLLETGVGACFPPALRARYGVEEDRHLLLDALADEGLSGADVDVVVLSHLHFDHAGGLLAPWREGATAALAFPRAQLLVGAAAWERACAPHLRDRASFLPELPDLLRASGRLHLAEAGPHPLLPEGWRLHRSDGHTPGMLLTEVATPGGPLVFAADLIPGAAWVHLPITMGYDRAPELLIDEKAALLEDLHARGGALLFTHDPVHPWGRVERDDRGRFSASDRGQPLQAFWAGPAADVVA